MSGHQNPNQSEAVMAMMRSQRETQMTNFLLQNDARAQFVARMSAGVFGGNAHGANNWMQEQGKAAAQAAGMVINNGAVSGLMGGSILDQYVGINSGLAASGQMKFGSTSSHPGGYSSGGGALNDTAARILVQRQQEEFFNSTGGARLDKTFGLNRSELGGVASYIGMNGGFSGMQMGRMHQIRNEGEYKAAMEKASASSNTQMMADLKAMRTDASGNNVNFENAPGQVMEITAEQSNAINSKISKGAEAMASIKDILGGRPALELMASIEKLSGVDVNAMDGYSQAKARVDRVKNFADTHGMSAQGVMREQLTIASQLEGMGVEGSAAAVASERIQARSQVAFDENNVRNLALSERGIASKKFSRDQLNAMGVGDVALIGKEFSTVSSAMAAMNTRTDLGEEAKANIQAGIDAVSNATGDTPAERHRNQKAAMVRLKKIYSDSTNGDSLDNYKDFALSAGSAGQMADIALGEGNARDKENVAKYTKQLDKSYGKGTSKAIAEFQTTLSMDTQSAIQKALANGDTDTANRLIQEADGLDAADKFNLTKVMAEQAGSPQSAKSFAAAMDAGSAIVAQKGLLAGSTSKQARNRADALKAQNFFASKEFGTGKSPQDVIANLREGLLGGTQITDEMKMEYATAKGLSTEIGTTKDGKFSMDAKDSAKLLGQDKDNLSKVFGLEGTDEERASKLQEQLNSTEGFNKFLKYAENSGGVLGKKKNGKTYYLGRQAKAEAAAALSSDQENKGYAELTGKTVDQIAEDRKKDPSFANRMAEQLGRDTDSIIKDAYSGKNGDGTIDKAHGGDDSAKKFNAFAQLAKQNGTQDMAIAAIDKLEKEHQPNLEKGSKEALQSQAKFEGMRNAIRPAGPEEIGKSILAALKEILGQLIENGR